MSDQVVVQAVWDRTRVQTHGAPIELCARCEKVLYPHGDVRVGAYDHWFCSMGCADAWEACCVVAGVAS